VKSRLWGRLNLLDPAPGDLPRASAEGGLVSPFCSNMARRFLTPLMLTASSESSGDLLKTACEPEPQIRWNQVEVRSAPVTGGSARHDRRCSQEEEMAAGSELQPPSLAPRLGFADATGKRELTASDALVGCW